MPFPDRFRSFFRPATIASLPSLAAKIRVSDVLFFRSAITASVIEKERRSFTPVIVIDDRGRISKWRCTCREDLMLGDLCRHMAMLLTQVSSDGGQLITDRFEASLWRAIGFSLFEDTRGRTLEQARESAAMTTSVDGRCVSRFQLANAAALDDLAGGAEGREALLRRITITGHEEELLRYGMPSARLAWEESFWYRWARLAFNRFGDCAEAFLVRETERFHLRITTEDAQIDVALAPPAVQHVLAAHDGAIVARSGLTLAPASLAPSFRITLTKERGLHFMPVLLDEDAIHLRSDLEKQRFGRWWFPAGRKAFATPRGVPPMFAEKQENDVQQSLLFAAEPKPSSGFPFEIEAEIPEDEIFRFIELHRDELAAMPEALVPKSVREARVVHQADETIFEIGEIGENHVELGITFRVVGETLTAADLAKARKRGVQALCRGNVWLDIGSAQFAWIDALEKPEKEKRERYRMRKIDYFRTRGLLRGPQTCVGDEAAQAFFRTYDELRNSSQTPSPAAFGMSLYDYQANGYQWLWFLQQNGLGGLLCDDMGLGKTHQAMALIAALAAAPHGNALSLLVVCPTSLLDHWHEKLATYVRGLSFERYNSGGRALPADSPAIITSYGVVRSNIDQFKGRRFDLLLLDEIQTIKNRGTATHQALATIGRRVAVGLTGTPVENHVGELKSLLDFVVPGYLPGETAFERSFAAPIAAGDERAREQLHQLIRPFVLRRTKAQVLTELPPKIVDKRYCELTPEQVLLYRRVLRGEGEPLREKLRSGRSISYIHVFATLNYLKQICNDPRSAGGGYHGEGPSGKWSLFTELLDECMDSGLKVVVFSQYLAMLGLIERHLGELGIAFATIKGSTQNRGDEIRRFQRDSHCRVFTASLRAGGLGIDLTAGSVVIHYDRWWNQAREDQATDRVHRPGQSKGVQVIKLITRNTIEEKIDAIIERKRELASSLVRPDDPALVKQFSRDELEELLRLEE
ncbi:MAG TPA: DEAD/DEAH box helicase [Thermoanaerobaculia bacterium]|nr:DEAD/DEAH box helicase [Thermoanaerobaculia bacterium]